MAKEQRLYVCRRISLEQDNLDGVELGVLFEYLKAKALKEDPLIDPLKATFEISSYDYYDGRASYYLNTQRFETDAEMNARLSILRKANADARAAKREQRKQREAEQRALYLKLKEKFEKEPAKRKKKSVDSSTPGYAGEPTDVNFGGSDF